MSAPGLSAAVAASAAGGAAQLRERLRNVRVGLRADLDISRHVFRGRASYIVRDPLTFQSQYFSAEDYAVLVQIDARRTLGQVLAQAVENGQLLPDDEDKFYAFVLRLHSASLLALPLSDDQQLYRRLQARRQQEARQRWTAVISYRLSLWDPDAFLDRTVGIVRPLFTAWFAMLWCLVVGGALALGWTHRHELWSPLSGVLAAGNLPLIWATLIVLKAMHELGHAYACKHFGGQVPDIGALFIVGTPCAYVDASAAWSFSSKRQRIIVSLAGMYVELLIAACATYVWALSSEGLLRDLAFNVMFLASGATILFNVNPLMRFDGYFVFADWVEIPNLRQRAAAALGATLQRIFLGLRGPIEPFRSRREQMLLLGYGVASGIYRVTLTLAIVTIVALKFGWLGLVAGGTYLVIATGGWLRKTVGWLWFAPETRPRRVRAVAYGGLLVAGVPLCIAFAPIRADVCAPGVLGREHELVLRTPRDVRVAEVRVQPGDAVAAASTLVQLESDDVREELIRAEAELDAARIAADALRVDDPSRARQQQETVALAGARCRRLHEELGALALRAPLAGEVTDCQPESAVGGWLRAGDAVAQLSAGAWVVRAELTDEQLADAAPRLGQPVVVRLASSPEYSRRGIIERISPAGARDGQNASLTQAGGGEIVVDAHGAAARAYFEVTIWVPADENERGPHGTHATVRFPGRDETIASVAWRRLSRLIDRIDLSAPILQ